MNVDKDKNFAVTLLLSVTYSFLKKIIGYTNILARFIPNGYSYLNC